VKAVKLGMAQIPCGTSARILGAYVSFNTKLIPTSLLSKKIETVATQIRRIGNLPISFAARSRMVAAQSCTQIYFGTEVTTLSKTQCRIMDSAILAAVWKETRIMRSREVLFSVLNKGHLLESTQVLAYRRTTGLIRMIQRRTDLRDQIGLLLQSHDGDFDQQMGPVGLAMSTLQQQGWTYVNGFSFTKMVALLIY
jgi:hypothetical protein